MAQPEDVIGLKVQAIANDPLRRQQDRLDIEALMERYGSRLNWERIHSYYELFELGAGARALKNRFGDVQ